MPRPPSLKIPALRIMQRELKRIDKLQVDAEVQGAVYALTEADRAAVLDAAKVGALLERGAKGGDDEDDEAEKKPADERAAIESLEKKLPPKVSRGPSGDDDDS